MEYNIEYCRNCLVCRNAETDDPYTECVIRDDMDGIKEDLVNADALVMATIVHMGYATAIMTVFLERIAWSFTKPEGKVLTLKGLPAVSRSTKKRRAIIIVPSGIVSPLYRRFCDWATPLIRSTIKDTLPKASKVPGFSFDRCLDHI